MKAAEKLLEKAKASGKVKERDEYLRLAPKNEQGVPTPNGPHKLKLVGDKIGTNNLGEQQLHVTVLEGKTQKLWTIPLKDKEGNLHYLVQTLAQYNEGDEIVVEMKKNGAKNYVEVKKVGDELPTITLDEDGEGASSELEDGEDVPPDDIPF